MSKPSTADLIRARLDDNASFQKLEERLEEMAEPGFSAWDLSHEQGVELLKKARRRSKKRKTDDVDDGGTDRIIPAFIDELEKSEKDEEARSDETYGANDIKIDTSKIEVDQEDLAWDAGTDEEIQMHSTAAPGSMPGAACIAIRNLVSKAVTNRIIDLEFVVARCQRFAIGYNPLRFAAATIRMKNPKCTVLIFRPASSSRPARRRKLERVKRPKWHFRCCVRCKTTAATAHTLRFGAGRSRYTTWSARRLLTSGSTCTSSRRRTRSSNSTRRPFTAHRFA